MQVGMRKKEKRKRKENGKTNQSAPGAQSRAASLKWQ
jgi:hypothetical protein